MKVVPKRLYQLIGLGSLLLLGVQAVVWILGDGGLYRLISGWLPFGEAGSPEKTLAAIILLFFALCIPWMAAILLLREFTADVKTMKDEVAYLKGESRPEPFITPAQQGRFTGVVAIVLGAVLLGINLILWSLTRDGLVALWLAVPVSWGLGIYALVSGKFPGR